MNDETLGVFADAILGMLTHLVTDPGDATGILVTALGRIPAHLEFRDRASAHEYADKLLESLDVLTKHIRALAEKVEVRDAN